ncbi:hypothetical protein ACO0K9_00880 [Undibacterium sp. Ji50W]|uniref:hypothetical protein n=1 Tax=Undibacterium sp. Ji50W TaxID=3413041 RepID=UPI003BF0CC24
MTIITLKNDFHNTEVTLRMKSSCPTEAQVKKSWNTLCGIKGCTCGNVMGMRGPQEVEMIGQEYLGGELVPKFSLPINPVGRPNLIEGGKRVNVYLDAESLAIAEQLGQGNVSSGIRVALTNSKPV